MELDEFRTAARAFLQARADAGTLPPDWGAILSGPMTDIGRRWQRDLFDAGFAAIDWPVEYAGRGLSVDHVGAWREAAAEFEAPAVLNMVGLVLTAGALLTFGTPEQ